MLESFLLLAQTVSDEMDVISEISQGLLECDIFGIRVSVRRLAARTSS